MASTTGSNQYSYVKASQMATRSLVGDEKQEHAISTASHDHPDAHDKPILAGKSTDNYEQAAAAAAKEGKGEAPIDPVSADSKAGACKTSGGSITKDCLTARPEARGITAPGSDQVQV
ncbi:hypothetical protein LTR56_023695 [Elasticomyces elasticus]|nr:hypothetical protein LTR56_023695 [Elasticomyces elasticus]KAK3624938.1 hypothetical protein LTR22_023761 [Elasticomyces elasticus]KAK4908934.1 hypothetical protein LTR49_022238 [Elasticomyces elasticus]KAK5745815.1 hypothetical protein LTS12_022967 [Elasticomyces elasticus]